MLMIILNWRCPVFNNCALEGLETLNLSLLKNTPVTNFFKGCFHATTWR